MNPNLSITKKTYYAIGILSVACSMLAALATLTAGQNMTMFDSLAYALTGIMLLFLAADKGSPAGRKGRYFVCFVLLMLSMLNQNPAVHLLLGAMVWPLLLALENAVGPDLKAQAGPCCSPRRPM